MPTRGRPHTCIDPVPAGGARAGTALAANRRNGRPPASAAVNWWLPGIRSKRPEIPPLRDGSAAAFVQQSPDSLRIAYAEAQPPRKLGGLEAKLAQKERSNFPWVVLCSAVTTSTHHTGFGCNRATPLRRLFNGLETARKESSMLTPQIFLGHDNYLASTTWLAGATCPKAPSKAWADTSTLP